MESISALRRGPDLTVAKLWSVKASRQAITAPAHLGDNAEVSLSVLDPNSGHRYKETWLLSTSTALATQFPEAIRPAFAKYQLRQPNFGLALNITSPSTSAVTSSRLFATLPLPISVSMPVHIHGTFIPSNDRRVIRFDAADAQGQRPLDCQYNDHLFRTFVPALYLRMLELVATSYKAQLLQSWPRIEPSDPISRVIVEALYQQFLTTSYQVLRTVTGTPIASTLR